MERQYEVMVTELSCCLTILNLFSMCKPGVFFFLSSLNIKHWAKHWGYNNVPYFHGVYLVYIYSQGTALRLNEIMQVKGLEQQMFKYLYQWVPQTFKLNFKQRAIYLQQNSY